MKYYFLLLLIMIGVKGMGQKLDTEIAVVQEYHLSDYEPECRNYYLTSTAWVRGKPVDFLCYISPDVNKIKARRKSQYYEMVRRLEEFLKRSHIVANWDRKYWQFTQQKCDCK